MLRKAIFGMSCLAALFPVACAQKDPTISRLEGAEPQRLSFGTPPEVQRAFADQMKNCWFSGAAAPLSGYQYDTKPAVLETGEGLKELPQIAIRSGSDAPGFLVQFYAFNNKTLISTRNLSFPVELAARLKRDVETGIFGRANCESATGSAITSGATVPAPQIGSAAVQQEATRQWSAGQEPASRY
jgi:hypothetical protein